MKLPEHIVDTKVGPKGPDVAVSFGNALSLTYWDIWCLLVAQQKFAGDLIALRDFLIDQRLNGNLFGSYRCHSAEDLIFLIPDIVSRLEGQSTVRDVLAKLPDRFKQKELPKALRNVIELSGSHAPSEPMLHSPRRALEREALRGMWPHLPINPAPIADGLSPLFTPKKKPSYFPKGTTYALARRIEKQVNREAGSGGLLLPPAAQRYATYRAALTLFHELHCWDDSYGEMGDCGHEWVKELLRETPSSIGVTPEIFLKDLLMFFCWENYGLSDSADIAKYIGKALSIEERKLSIDILTGIKTRARAGFQDYHADCAERILKSLSTTPHEPLARAERALHLCLVVPHKD